MHPPTALRQPAYAAQQHWYRLQNSFSPLDQRPCLFLVSKYHCGGLPQVAAGGFPRTHRQSQYPHTLPQTQLLLAHNAAYNSLTGRSQRQGKQGHEVQGRRGSAEVECWCSKVLTQQGCVRLEASQSNTENTHKELLQGTWHKGSINTSIGFVYIAIHFTVQCSTTTLLTAPEPPHMCTCTPTRVGAMKAYTSSRLKNAAAEAAPKSSVLDGQGKGFTRTVRGAGYCPPPDCWPPSRALSSDSCRLTKNQ